MPDIIKFCIRLSMSYVIRSLDQIRSQTWSALDVLVLLYWQVFEEHRHVEELWHDGKVRLHQRLGLRLFQQDVKQVGTITWGFFKFFPVWC